MDNVLSGQGQPVIINHDRHGGGKEKCCDEILGELISTGDLQNAIRHNDGEVRAFGLHTEDEIERFGLRTLDELCHVRHDIAESKFCINNKIVDDGQRTRDLIREQTQSLTNLIRDQETTNLRAEVAFLQIQLLNAGVIPAAKKG
jgi:hypothetical protein